MLGFPFVEALLGRRSRRFFRGASIPSGPFAFHSRHEALPLTELEKMLIISAASGNTGWNYLIMHNPRYAPFLPNYSGAAGGRTFPSAAGFHTSELFFTDDDGVYMLETRDAPDLRNSPDKPPDMEKLIEAHRSRVRKIYDGRMNLPPAMPHLEGHNTWVVNCPGSLLLFPVADVAQHNIANLCYYLQNGSCIYDDVNGRPIPGLESFPGLYDPESLLPLSILERGSLLETATELSASCYAGALMLQAVGLGGWMFDGINPDSVLGMSGDPAVPGLGFQFETVEGWTGPNATGLPGFFEAFCPPRFASMREAVDAYVLRKYGPGGPFNSSTPGPWENSPGVRGSAQVHSDEFKQCVTLQAQYIFDNFHKFPGTVPTVLTYMYLQAHHLDLDFYDKFFTGGACLESHARHMELWHEKT
jgi:hypothetical protein